ncbi:uncharacterized protein F4807DRAFT_450548 [Annulohypoxylon truncatum]|uniref:uncharacterized protein n=1 Tax=Annulohypoxylon truncatum TaxID=327061 RepID=UPI002007B4C9|nr:uncharacterized protein F4807DRAFT_450548 [Annulohypoxylon truncatum]KAI1211815.1 hypothetical protein F4807DRAFT_450548 [Annulohypoxylon truncatum]
MAASVQKLPSLDLARGPDGSPPELREADYLTQVLQLSPETTDAYFNELIMKATHLGIAISRPSSATSADNKRNLSGAESSITIDTNHARSTSTGSQGSASTNLTSHSSNNGHSELAGRMITRKRSRALTFGQYETYLAQVDPTLKQNRFLSPSSTETESAPSIFSVGTNISYVSLKRGLSKLRRRRKNLSYPGEMVMSCSACREDLQPDQTLQRLPCGHSYCPRCLKIMINQAATEESKMPPRCCAQPIPSSIIKSVLPREEQMKFLKAVVQFSTPWEARVFCSNPACGEFIPPRAKIDPKYPFQAICRKCKTRVCAMCKRDAHPPDQDCPDDWELKAVLKMGEKSGWRRCYKCRTLVELSQGCTHMTCRCRAQFCYICGAVWDPMVGCPNVCNGEAEMERRRHEEEERLAELAKEEAAKEEAAEREKADRLEAEGRTRGCEEFKVLRAEQVKEMVRFQTFERKSKWLMWTRHAHQKLALVEKQSTAIERMKERHAKTSANLEDRQVAAEMELRSTLEQSERNVRIRLKHMEAYCDGLGKKPDAGVPSRVVTERDLRELGQQYNVEKNMRQLHQAKINVMRDRQAKALEELLERQESEMEKLMEKNRKEIESLESDFADEEDALTTTFVRRKSTLENRWELEMEVMRRELEKERGLKYASMKPLEWPDEEESLEDGLPVVEE